MRDMLHKLGNAIRVRRKAKGMTLADLSKAAGVTLGYISQIERGESSPSLEVLKKLADAIDCPMAILIHAAEVIESPSEYANQGVG